MAQTVSSTLGNGLKVTETFSTGFTTAPVDTTLVPTLQYVSGNASVSLGINASFLKGAVPVTLTTGASVTYTLTSCTDDAGRAISFANGVKLIMFYVTSRSAGDYLTIGNAGTNPWQGPFGAANSTVKCYDVLVLGVGSTDRYTVTGGASEQLKVLNSGSNSITFKMAVLGNA